MNLLDMVIELIIINKDITHRRKKLEEFDIYDFDQTWASTALGFGGVGGSAITTARTYVLIPYDHLEAYVYFGGRFAYKCDINDRFYEDLRQHKMARVVESTRYIKKEKDGEELNVGD